MSPKDTMQLAYSVLTENQKKRFEMDDELDFSFGIQNLARFRGNCFKQRGCVSMVIRQIPFSIKTFDDLKLPDVIRKMAERPRGLVLVTGPTGSGKSTTLAGVMRSIIEKRPVHIVTIEDPIEFLFADGKAAVSQREVSTDSPSFGEALKNMFRQDPDVIMVGEMRDWGTMQTAITAAETGHLVFSTLHTNSAAQSIDRIIDSCPQEQQAQVRSQLSIVLRAIVSMNLIETSDGSGRCAVVEVMINSPKIEKHILSGEVKEIHEEIENSVNYYKMQSMNQCLIALLVNKRITYAKAMELSTDPEDLSLKLRKLFPQIEENQRGGLMASDNDFSQITQLIEIKRLYEEQEEKWKLRLSEKEEELNKYMMELRDQRRVIEGRDQVLTDVEGENNRLKADNDRVSREFQQKIAQLNDRIKELNQRLVLAEGGPKAAAGQGGGGFFKK